MAGDARPAAIRPRRSDREAGNDGARAGSFGRQGRPGHRSRRRVAARGSRRAGDQDRAGRGSHHMLSSTVGTATTSRSDTLISPMDSGRRRRAVQGPEFTAPPSPYVSGQSGPDRADAHFRLAGLRRARHVRAVTAESRSSEDEPDRHRAGSGAATSGQRPGPRSRSGTASRSRPSRHRHAGSADPWSGRHRR